MGSSDRHEAAEPVVDVCVVGGGPVGQMCAQALAARGLRVVLVEAGAAFASGRANRACPTVVEGDERYGGLEWKAWRAFGGTSWAWGIDLLGLDHGVRLAPVETAVVERDVPGLPRWPLTAEQMAALQQRALDALEVDVEIDSLQPQAADGIPMLDEGAYVFTSGRRFHDPHALVGVQVFLGTTVTRLVPAQDEVAGVASGVAAVEHINARGERGVLACEAVVLAANSIENARLALLLRQELPRLRGTRIGVGFMDRPRVTGELTTNDRPKADWGRFALLRSLTVFRMARWCAPSPLVLHGGASVGVVFAPVLPSAGGRRRAESGARLLLLDLPRRLVVHGAPRFGVVLRRTYPWRARQFRRVSSQPHLDWAVWAGRAWQDCTRWSLTASVEMLPDPANRLELIEDAAHGEPDTRLVWGAPASRAASAATLDTLSAAFHEAGIGAVQWPSNGFDTVSSHHLMGGLAFGADAETDTACDQEGRLRGTRNVFAAGACLFPTSGHANPTLAALALGLHVSDCVGTAEGSTAAAASAAP